MHQVRAGDIIHVKGVTDDTVHGRIYAGCRFVEILSHKAATPPQDVSATEFLSGRHDYKTTRITGMVRDVFRDEIDPRVAFLILAFKGHSIYVALSVDDKDTATLKGFVGATVTAEGLCRPSAHGMRRQIGRFIKAEDISYIHIVTPPPADPFDVPDISTCRQLQASELSSLGRRRVAGLVIAVWRGNKLLLKTKAGRVVRVDLADNNPPDCGLSIEVAGLPETDLYNINLTRAIWRLSQESPFTAEAPSNVSADALMFDNEGRLRINTSFHGKPIRLRGFARRPSDAAVNDGLLYMDCGRCIVPIDASSCPNALQDVVAGCEIEVTGICVMESENWRSDAPFPHVQGFMVVVRTPEDVRIISHPPWWTPGRLMVVIGVLLTALAGIFLWNRSLNRLAERRGRELSEETVAHIAADLKVGERTRLAIELHDALSQNLTGAALEIETSDVLIDDNPAQAHHHLGIAAKTVKSCREELRNCLWDLRNDALGEKTMDAAIRRTLAPVMDGTNIAVRFNVPRERLFDDTAHALLRIIRELTQNAMRHGHAKTVKVAGSLETDRLLFSVQDDGCGFDPENHPGVQQGHFGLQGIRERVKRFGGTMEIKSEMGKGAKVTIALNLGNGGRQA
jgi:signal transduction histidine kinase